MKNPTLYVVIVWGQLPELESGGFLQNFNNRAVCRSQFVLDWE